MRRANRTGLSVRQARGLINRLAGQAQADGVNVVSDLDMPIGLGATSDSALFGDGSARFGIAELKFSVGNYFGHAAVDDLLFTTAVVSLYHEGRHVDVFQRLQSGDSSVNSELVAAHIARQGSDQYYFHNRLDYVTEIDAERQGVLNAHARLLGFFGEDIANDLICDYVNDQCHRFSYYLDANSEFSNIADIEKAFEDAYEIATSDEPVVRDKAGRPCESMRYREIYTAWHDDESLAQLFDSSGRMKSGCEQVFDAMWDASNTEKDRMMASLSLSAIPELADFYSKTVTDELDVTRVFGDACPSALKPMKDDGIGYFGVTPIVDDGDTMEFEPWP